MAGEDWLQQAVGFYRGLGFFASEAGFSNSELAHRLFEEHRDEWGEPVPPPVSLPPLGDILVMSKDVTRTLWLDLECGALPGNNVYADVVQQLAAISLGTFAPTKIDERWAEDGSAVTVSFYLDGVTREIKARGRGDWFDATAIAAVNELLGAAPRRFCALSPGDQTIVIVSLTAEDRSALASRGVEARPLTMEEVEA